MRGQLLTPLIASPDWSAAPGARVQHCWLGQSLCQPSPIQAWIFSMLKELPDHILCFYLVCMQWTFTRPTKSPQICKFLCRCNSYPKALTLITGPSQLYWINNNAGELLLLGSCSLPLGMYTGIWRPQPQPLLWGYLIDCYQNLQHELYWWLGYRVPRCETFQT